MSKRQSQSPEAQPRGKMDSFRDFLSIQDNGFIAVVNLLLLMALAFCITQILGKVVADVELRKLFQSWLAPLLSLIPAALVALASYAFRSSNGETWKKFCATLGKSTILVAIVVADLVTLGGYSVVSNPCFGVHRVDDNVMLVNVAYFDGKTDNGEVVNSWVTVLTNEIAQAVLDQGVQLKQLAPELAINSDEDARIINECSNAKLTIWWGTVTNHILDVRYRYNFSGSFSPALPASSYLRGTEQPEAIDTSVGVYSMDSFSVFVEGGGDSEYILTVVAGAVQFANANYGEAFDLFSYAISLVPEVKARQVRLDTVYQMRASTRMYLNVIPELSGDDNMMYEARNNEINGLILGDLEESLKINPDNTETLTLLGLIQFLIGDAGASVETFTQIIQIDPNMTQAYRIRAQGYLALNQYELALSDINRSIELAENDVELAVNYGVRGKVYLALGSPNLAIVDLTRSIESHDSYMLRLDRSHAYLALKDWRNALIDVNRSIDMQPRFWSSRYHRGRILQAMGRIEEAILDFQTIGEIQPDNPWGHFQLGLILDSQGNWEEALLKYDLVLQMDPSFYLAYLNRATTYDRFSPDLVLSELNSAVQFDESGRAYILRGYWYFVHGQIAEAISDLQTGISIRNREMPGIRLHYPGDLFQLHDRQAVLFALGNYEFHNSYPPEVLEIVNLIKDTWNLQP